MYLFLCPQGRKLNHNIKEKVEKNGVKYKKRNEKWEGDKCNFSREKN